MSDEHPLYILAPGGKVILMAALESPSPHYADVALFHRKFGAPSHLDTPFGLPPDDLFQFRYKFLTEELHELISAYQDKDLQKYLDALLDLVYVAYGTALSSGVSPELWYKLWATVQEANMTKVKAASIADSKRGWRGDVVKPAGWVSPDAKQKALIMDALLNAQDDVGPSAA